MTHSSLCLFRLGQAQVLKEHEHDEQTRQAKKALTLAYQLSACCHLLTCTVFTTMATVFEDNGDELDCENMIDK